MEAENAVEKLKKNGKPAPKELADQVVKLQLYNDLKQRHHERWFR